ncbi:UNVERIFIED_CONTAM: ribulose-bisphosphate carboxylase large chain [Acetivibrio alkalicellulosi]
MYFDHIKEYPLSGERFYVQYHLTGDEKEAYEKAKDICIEQTVEFPEDLIHNGFIRDSIFGKIQSFEKINDNAYKVIISYAIEITSKEFTQFLNVLFGNISIKPGIRLEHIGISPTLEKWFQGPKFGIDGIRERLDVKDKPLFFTAVKPMGLSSKELAKLAYTFSLGGIDIIKDDHGLSNQEFCPFEERVELCCKAVQKSNDETGRKSIFVPNITAPHREMIKKAKLAKDLGAGGLLISPGLSGFDVVRDISIDQGIDLPIFCHPAFLGSYVFGESGIAHQVLFGEIPRLSGADATIFPNFGGRFSFSLEECRKIATSGKEEYGSLKPIFPCPAGGMTIKNIPSSLEVYGKDVAFLVGGGIFKLGPDLLQNIKAFRKILDGN